MDYIPRKRSDRYLWWKGISDNIVVEAPKFGLSAPDGLAAKAIADAILAKMDATDTAQNALDSARNLETQSQTTNEAAIRAAVRNWKTLSGYPASGSEAVLQLKGAGVEFDPNTYKTTLKATVTPGQVKIDFTKKGVDGVNIYCRLRGTVGWTKLSYDSNPPYFDTAPPQTPNVPEVREYKARGVLADVEIGLDSDIVTATFAG